MRSSVSPTNLISILLLVGLFAWIVLQQRNPIGGSQKDPNRNDAIIHHVKSTKHDADHGQEHIRTPITLSDFDRRCAEAATYPVLNSYVELRSATDVCPKPGKPPPPQIPYPDVSICPFLQSTNNKPTPINEHFLPSKPFPPCQKMHMRVNMWCSQGFIPFL